MLETDAPYLLPRNLSGKPVEKNRNEPCYLPHIAGSVAEYMGLQEAQLVAAAYANTRKFFSI
jgi:TatD DNase family protein